MIPLIDDDLRNDLTVESAPTNTYKWDYESEKKTCREYRDNLEAIKQACYKIIYTERYRHLIYSWNYGIELEDLFGKPLTYVYPELKRRIKEALLADDRVSEVDSFKFSHKRGEVLAEFRVITDFGDFTMGRSVNI